MKIILTIFHPNKKWGKRVVALFSKRILNQTSCVIAPTAKVHSILKSYGVTQPIEVVPTGIDMDKFMLRLTDNDKERLREKLNIPKENKVLYLCW